MKPAGFEKDPGQAWLRRRRWSDPPLRGVTVHGRHEDLLVLWAAETYDDEPAIVIRGSRLLAAVLAHADARGFARVVLHPSERAIPFYRRFGFDAENDLLVRPGAR